MPVVKFYASLRDLIGVKEKVIPGVNIRLILANLINDCPEIKSAILNGDKLRAIITLNGKTLAPEIALDTAVSEQDQIAIFPPFSGG